jgi:hypothetical protein
MYRLYKDMRVTEFIKFRRLQWAGQAIIMELHRLPKKSRQQGIHCKRRIGNPRKRWEDEMKDDVVMLLGIRTWKTKAKDGESWRQRIEEA